MSRILPDGSLCSEFPVRDSEGRTFVQGETVTVPLEEVFPGVDFGPVPEGPTGVYMVGEVTQGRAGRTPDAIDAIIEHNATLTANALRYKHEARVVRDELDAARERNAALNRRCQRAESAVLEKIATHPGPSLGRALANAGGEMAIRERDAARAWARRWKMRARLGRECCRQADAAIVQLATATALLRDVEWSGHCAACGGRNSCVDCGSCNKPAHMPDCKLAAFLASPDADGVLSDDQQLGQEAAEKHGAPNGLPVGEPIHREEQNQANGEHDNGENGDEHG